ncbi:glycoside hydrolase family 13 protein [Anaerosporobacter faecicola]|uniref:glycoside hydrolase family 13 protein n=1 Tax=Anaerosporobacter faecicola TaxID=2718714 RepID=UPI00143C0E31|nr:glycoside hydrolase family 13 protein [Anaerosporobacter faecicola]
MNKSAILHIPLSQYAFATGEHSLTIRIRTGRDDLTSCILYYGDRACNFTPVRFDPLPMKKIGDDSLYSYYEANLESDYNRICYYFKLEKNEEWYYYYADQFTKQLADVTIDSHIIEGRSEYYQYPYILREEIVDVPEWFKDAIVYNIFPDSFADQYRDISQTAKNLQVKLQNSNAAEEYTTSSKARLGGTIEGIRKNLDYIKELGFNCIYLNPIFVAGESHKYDILDYYHIDPCFGTDEDFATLVKEIHALGMHIIIDGVFNHCSWYFFAFEDVVRHGRDSAYVDWFYDLNFPVIRPEDAQDTPQYACFAYERKMPKLNTSNEEVQEYFAKVGEYWIQTYGVDGWRLDVANEIDRNFWRRFRQAVRNVNKEAVLIGEVWEDSSSWLRGDAFDSTMNYDFRKHCRSFFALHEITGKQFTERVLQMYLRYPSNLSVGQLNLLDSHDVPRFLSLCKEEENTYCQAIVFLILFPGVPSVFYGDEKGVVGITENEYRQPMPWKKEDETAVKITDLLRSLLAIRKRYLHALDPFTMGYEKETPDVIYLSRQTKKGTLMAWFNGSSDLFTIDKRKMGTILLSAGYHEGFLEGRGFVVTWQE